MKNALQTFEPNELGRDFVIGDLHGSFSIFQNLLDNLDFDKTKDRMFSVGDLVDRGPDSLACLELLYEPWFHCVLSNHEQMMIETLNNRFPDWLWIRNGGAWAAEALVEIRALNATPARVPADSTVRLLDLMVKVEELPFLITVKLPNGERVHIIHAELPPNQPVSDAILEDPEAVEKLATIQCQDGNFFLWGRWYFLGLYMRTLENIPKLLRTFAYSKVDATPNLSHVISGHTIMHRPVTLCGRTNIDTGAYGSYSPNAPDREALTCLELKTWTFFQATETKFRTVQPAVINKSDIDKVRTQGYSHEND